MKIPAAVAWLTKPWHLWVFVFTYTVCAGLFVQLVLLPHVFPAWHAGHGLITGVDGQKFHRRALEMAQAIERAGWAEWDLEAGGQSVSGLASIFYVLIYPEPWSVLPMNGLLNATACLCLYLMLARISGERLRSLFAAAPFILFPSAMLWNSQFHNENYAVPGVICLLYGWMILARPEGPDTTVWSIQSARGLALIAAGSLLLGIVRAQALGALANLMILASVGLVIAAVIRKTRLGGLVWLVAMCASGAAMMFISAEAFSDTRFLTTRGEVHAPNVVEGQGSGGPRKWISSNWLPQPLDRRLRAISEARRQSARLSQPGDAGIDTQIQLRSAGDVLAYAPRALQIALFSPFPRMWFSEARNESGSAMRAVSAFEMLLVYLSLLGLPLFLHRYRSDRAVWFVLFVCAGMLVLFAMTVTNVGALYRFRYPFLMPLVSMGVAGWLALRPESPSAAGRVEP